MSMYSVVKICHARNVISHDKYFVLFGSMSLLVYDNVLLLIDLLSSSDISWPQVLL
jgi:hypothetical protein